MSKYVKIQDKTVSTIAGLVAGDIVLDCRAFVEKALASETLVPENVTFRPQDEDDLWSELNQALTESLQANAIIPQAKADNWSHIMADKAHQIVKGMIGNHADEIGSIDWALTQEYQDESFHSAYTKIFNRLMFAFASQFTFI